MSAGLNKFILRSDKKFYRKRLQSPLSRLKIYDINQHLHHRILQTKLLITNFKQFITKSDLIQNNACSERNQKMTTVHPTNQPCPNPTHPICDLNLTDQPASGIYVIKSLIPVDQKSGRWGSFQLNIPKFTQASYYATYQDFDPLHESGGRFPMGSNRMQAVHSKDLKEITPGGVLLLLELENGMQMAILTLVAPAWDSLPGATPPPSKSSASGSCAYLTSEDGKLTVNVGNLGKTSFSADTVLTDIPTVAWATADNVYEACQQVWEIALTHPRIAQTTRLRQHKHYPNILTHLGWCSWEQYKMDISEEILSKALDNIESADLPIRYVLVDDGHLHHDERHLVDFEIDPIKFPNGWQPLLSRRHPDRIKWFGLWLCFNGYWSGLASDGNWDGMAQHLETIDDKTIMPKQGFTHTMAFYDGMISKARQAGFDFVKVDDQAQNPKFYKESQQGIASSIDNAQALEAACARHMDGLINCMAHSNICAFNTRVSAVTRCSEDYKVNDAWRAKAHLHNSFANMLWLGPTVWGDHDMFHSNDALAGYAMAVSKAVSGGPVYLSDDPADFDPTNVLPLCYADGKLLRPLAPAVPLPDSVYMNPFIDALAYRTIAPLANGSVAVTLFNLTEPTQPVAGCVRVNDYQQATAMLPDHATWPLPQEGLVCYDWQNKQAIKLSDDHTMTLNKFECQLYLLCPIQHGIALIGATNKYLAPAAITFAHIDESQLIVHLHEAADLTVYSEKPLTSQAQMQVTEMGEYLYRIRSTSSKPCVIHLQT